MNTWRNRLALWLLFVFTGSTFNDFANFLPTGSLFAMIYYGCAATVDLMMFRFTRYFTSGKVQRDIELLCIASVFVNAIGWALYQSKISPTIYDNLIAGLNYVLAIRLLLAEGNIIDCINHFYRSIVVRYNYFGHSYHFAKKEE